MYCVKPRDAIQYCYVWEKFTRSTMHSQNLPKELTVEKTRTSVKHTFISARSVARINYTKHRTWLTMKSKILILVLHSLIWTFMVNSSTLNIEYGDLTQDVGKPENVIHAHGGPPNVNNYYLISINNIGFRSPCIRFRYLKYSKKNVIPFTQ